MVNWKRLFFVALAGLILTMGLCVMGLKQLDETLDLAEEAVGIVVEYGEIIIQQTKDIETLQDTVETLRSLLEQRVTIEATLIPEVTY